MIQRTEGNFQGHAGNELFFQTWSAPGARATLVVTHGMSEHSECYNLFANAIVPKGYDVIAWDLPGHGRSEGKRGYIADFKNFVADLEAFLAFLKGSGRLSKPYVLVAHSMGGLILLRYLIEAEKVDAVAACLSSPLLGIALPVPKLKDLSARLLFRMVPTLTLFNEIRYENLSRDREVLKAYPTDALRHDKISPALYLGMIENMAYVAANARKVQLPFLMQIAGIDRVVSRRASEEFFAKVSSPKKKLLIYEDSYHEIYNDLDREKVYGELDAFLRPLLEGK